MGLLSPPGIACAELQRNVNAGIVVPDPCARDMDHLNAEVGALTLPGEETGAKSDLGREVNSAGSSGGSPATLRKILRRPQQT